MIVRLRDIIAVGFCKEGARLWADLHGVDFNILLEGNLTVDMLRQFRCPLANRVCDEAEQRTRGSYGQ